MKNLSKQSLQLLFGMLLTLLFTQFAYGEDFDSTQSKKSSIGTTISHEPKRSPVDEYITITVEKEGYDFRKAWYEVKFGVKDSKKSEDVIVSKTSMGEVKLSVKVPEIDNITGIHLAKPIAVIVVIKNGDEKDITIATHKFMLSSRPLAIIFWLLAFFTPWLIASRITATRNGMPTSSKFNPIWFVSGYSGKASLSLAQILIWTMLVFSASFYVLEISGKLLDLTNDVLILLGITGGVSLISKIVSTSNTQEEDEKKEVVIEEDPKWMDLFQSDCKPDLFKVQMALFTVLAVIFVTGQIYAELLFPKFPEGLLALITISNGIYLGSKGARNIKASEQESKGETKSSNKNS